MRHHKLLKHSVDKLVSDMKEQRTRHGQARYLLGMGTVFLICGTALAIGRPQWEVTSGFLIVAGVLTWIVGWRKTN